MPSFSKAELAPKTQNPRPLFSWRPTDPEGRRWELWNAGRYYEGRLLVLYRSNGQREILVGHFTSLAVRGRHGASPVPARWIDRHARSLKLGARMLMAVAQKKSPAARKQRGRVRDGG